MRKMGEETESETAGVQHPTVCRQLINNKNFKYLFNIDFMSPYKHELLPHVHQNFDSGFFLLIMILFIDRKDCFED